MAGQLTGEDETELLSELEVLMTSTSISIPKVASSSNLIVESDTEKAQSAVVKIDEGIVALPVAPDTPIFPKIPENDVKIKKLLA